MSAVTEPLSGDSAAKSLADDNGPVEDNGRLIVFDVATVPDDPPDAEFYRHRPDMLQSARELLRRWDVMFTLAERDIRAQYKQAVLGVAWALLVPLVNLAMLGILASHVSGFSPGGHVPWLLWAYSGLLAWGLFGGAIGGGMNSLVANKALMAKSHFPRECFPLSQVLESAFGSVIAMVPLVILFAVYGWAPRLATLWSPLYLAIEIPFTLGLVFLVSSLVVTMRDLQQVVPILMPLIMLITVLKPLAVAQHNGHVLVPAFITDPFFRVVYCFFNPAAAVLSSFRDSLLLGFGPQWETLIAGAVGSLGYLILGYTVFKRLEVNFADLT